MRCSNPTPQAATQNSIDSGASTRLAWGRNPLTTVAWLTRIKSASTTSELQHLMFDLHAIGVPAFFEVGARPDRAVPTLYRAEIHQSPLFATGDAEDLFEASGMTPRAARQQAQWVLAIDNTLKQHRLEWGMRWEPTESEHPHTLAGLSRLAPGLDWQLFADRIGLPKDATINVTAPAYLKDAAHVWRDQHVPNIRAYLRWSFFGVATSKSSGERRPGTSGPSRATVPSRNSEGTWGGVFPPVLAAGARGKHTARGPNYRRLNSCCVR